MTTSLKIICSSTSRGWHYFQKVVVSHESPKNLTLCRAFTWATWRWWDTAGQQRPPHHWAEDKPADIYFFFCQNISTINQPLCCRQTRRRQSSLRALRTRAADLARQASSRALPRTWKRFVSLQELGGGDQILNSSSVASSGLSNLKIRICETLGINMNSMIACYRRLFNWNSFWPVARFKCSAQVIPRLQARVGAGFSE